MTPQEMVREFHEAFGAAIADSPTLSDSKTRSLRYALIAEEFDEFDEALLHGDLVEVADALADLVVVIYGTALSFGLDLDDLVAEVHRSNMSKLGADGLPIVREDGKILKGPNYTPPDIPGELSRQAALAEGITA